MLDRVAPTRRPDRRPIGYQNWRDLLFLHWPVTEPELRRLVPAPLELDLWKGVGYLGVVPFRMEGVRSSWWPRACALAFLETNVRTYVHYQGRPGIYFLSLDANSLAAVCGARLGWNLPYYPASLQLARSSSEIHYVTRRWRSRSELEVRCQPGAALGPAVPGTLEHFFLERYLLFVPRRRGVLCGQVHHRPYPAQRVAIREVRESIFEVLGVVPGQRPPAFAHYASGVDVEIFPLERLRPGRG